MTNKSETASYDDYLGYDPEVMAKEAENARKGGGGDGPANKLKAKLGLNYHMVLLPYIHGKKGMPPMVNVFMHYGIGGRSFPCLYKNGLDERCVADKLEQALWDQYHTVKEDEAARKDVLSQINKVQAKSRWYSPVRVLNVTDPSKNNERVQDEYDKWVGKDYLWWDYPDGIFNDLKKAYGIYGALHNPKKPIEILFMKDYDTDEQGRKSSYPKPSVFFISKGNELAYVKTKADVKQLLESVPSIYESKLFNVLSNDEIRGLITKNYGSKGEDKSADFPPGNSVTDEAASSVADDPFAPTPNQETDGDMEMPDGYEEQLGAVFDGQE